MGKYDIEYFRCRQCRFVQTENPYWLEEAYACPIVPTDIGLVSRNEHFSRVTDRILRFVYPDVIRCVDYGGGYGMFTRMMRDRGHHFLHRDPFCENLFAGGLEADPDERGFDFLTAFEVFEHFSDPQADLARLDEIADHWLVSTDPIPDPAPKPDEWWYYMLDSGQHISLWSKKALRTIADQYDRELISYRGLHLFSRSHVNAYWARQLLRDRSAKLLDGWRRRRSLLQDDFARALASSGKAA